LEEGAMTRKDIVTMSQEELRRLHVMHKIMEKAMTQADAAGKIGLCERQVRRVVARIREEGDRGIIHRLRGKPSNRALPEGVKNKVLELFKDKYPDFGPTLASEKLFERDKIKINDETLRCWLIEREIPYKKRRKRPHRQWRERRAHYGEMVQLDGSHHDWFEGRGEPCVLMGYIDDATGRPFAQFYPYEGTVPAMDSFKRYIKKQGLPLSVYLDKHTTYKSTGKPSIEEELNNTAPLSQFERALKELGVEVIHANSPQAKGRVERLFETFQDRLIKEMRLEEISSMETANKFLGKYLGAYGKRFGVQPAQAGNLHRPVGKDVNLDRILCIKTEHSLRNDFTVAHNNTLYQILDNVRAKRVMVEEHINGSIRIWSKDSALRFKVIQARPKKEPVEKLYTFRARPIVPKYNHPWRIEARMHYQQYERKAAAHKEKELVLTKT
jgi:transposase